MMFMKAIIINLFACLFILLSSNSFDRVMCQRLSGRLTVEFEDREADIRARDGQRASKRAERRRAKAEKKLKKIRDETEKEKAQR